MNNSIKEVNFCISYTDSKEKKIKVPPNKDFQKSLDTEQVPNIEIKAFNIDTELMPEEMKKELENRHNQRVQLTHAPSMKQVSELYEKNSEDFNNFKDNNIR